MLHFNTMHTYKVNTNFKERYIYELEVRHDMPEKQNVSPTTSFK